MGAARVQKAGQGTEGGYNATRTGLIKIEGGIMIKIMGKISHTRYSLVIDGVMLRTSLSVG